jgi:Calcium-activated chloride channel
VWFELSVMWQVPVAMLRDYFGEKTALYFAFIAEYMRWQTFLAIAGLIVSVDVM